MLVPTCRLLWIMVAGLLLAVLPILIAETLWMLVVGSWLGLLLIGTMDMLPLLRAQPELTTEIPTTIGVGDHLRVKAAVYQHSSQALWVTLRPEVTAPLEASLDVDGWLASGRSDHEVPIWCPRRGRGVVAALWLRIEAPLKLVCRITRIPVSAEAIRVLPNTRHVQQLALEYFGTWQQQGSVRLNRVGEGTELDSLDAYQPGMDLRAVDWKATARHQALRIRRFQTERNQRIILCFDTGRLMAEPIEGLQRLDHAIHAGLLLAHSALKGSDLVGMHAYGAEPESWVPPRSDQQQVRRLVEACASLEPRDGETNHVLGIHDLLRRLDRRSLVVVFTELTDPTMTELMVEYVGYLARRHLVVFLALDDPVLEIPFTVPPDTPRALAEASVAGSMRQERDRVLHKLRRQGVDIVHGSPHRAPLELLRRYVRMKRRRLLG